MGQIGPVRASEEALRTAPAWQKLRDLVDRFPFGLAPFIILSLTLIAAGWLAGHPIPKTEATLRLWTFANIHAMAYEKVAPAFEAKHPGTTVSIQLVHGTAVTSRLRAAFWSDLDVPDLVEVEISSAGSFFRGPIDDIGFVDLTPRLKSTDPKDAGLSAPLLKDGSIDPTSPGPRVPLYDRIVKTRFAPYSNRDRIFGLPHDVHPVMLAYRRDLFEELGIQAEELDTWDKFIAVGRKITKPGERYMIEFSDSGSGNFEPILFQRDGGYFDADGKVTMDNEIAVQTVLWYIPLVAGPGRIGNDLGWGDIFTRAVEAGYFLTFICPDWRSKGVEESIPRMAGKMALMPVPAFTPGGRRTTTWGGTMLGLTRKCRNPDLTWKLAQHLYLDTESLAERFRELNILPPLRDAWRHPAFAEPRPYWSNQPIGTLYTALADQVPPQFTSPFIELAKSKMSEVISACAQYYREHGDVGFDAFARECLRRAADQVRLQMARNPF